MTGHISPMGRRNFLRMSLATAAVVSAGGVLSACGSESGTGGTSGATGTKSANNPFGVAKNSTVDAVIFDGGYKTDYFEFAGDVFEKQHGGTVKTTPTTKVSQQMQPRFMGGNPPDILDNSGAESIPLTSIIDQVADLKDVIEAKTLEGETISDLLYSGVTDSTTIDGKIGGLNYVMTVYAMWYSKTLFEENGWTVPKTWDEALELGAEAKKQGKFLYTWGKEASDYYAIPLVDSAIKEGGREVYVALANLEPDSWKQEAVVNAFKGLEAIVKAGYVKPGGAGTQFTQAQADWSFKQEALMYPSGSWIEAEMKDQTADNFQMTGAAPPAVSDSPAMGPDALRASASELFVVPEKAKNQAAGKELLRIMLSKEAATNFAKTKLALPVVQGVVPEDGFGSSALVSQASLLEAAGENVLSYNFLGIYPFWETLNSGFNSFLAGDMSADELLDNIQAAADKFREDDAIKKVKVD